MVFFVLYTIPSRPVKGKQFRREDDGRRKLPEYNVNNLMNWQRAQILHFIRTGKRGRLIKRITVVVIFQNIGGGVPVKHFFKRFAVLCGAAAFALLGTGMALAGEFPDNFTVAEGQRLSFPDSLHMTAVSSSAVPADAALHAGTSYTSDLRLFGLIPVKSVKVDVTQPVSVIPGGQVFGIKLFTQGVMVVGMSDVDTANGPKNPAYDAGVRKGDIILTIDGKTVNDNDDVAQAFSAASGSPVTLDVRRNGSNFEVKVKPLLSVSENAYKAGLWVRDSTAGIGTVTFYRSDSGAFGGLGHGICDVDTGEILPLSSGQAVGATISDILRGTRGHTGELQGTLDDQPLGDLLTNQPTGIYGVMQQIPSDAAVPVAMSQQVHTGNATILSTLDATGPHAYSVRIEKVYYDADNPTKNMVIRITDKTLLAKTGGIVQGMSGSPILQDGRLVGAVTHVFVNDPSRGYGIFAENMIKTLKTIENYTQKVVS